MRGKELSDSMTQIQSLIGIQAAYLPSLLTKSPKYYSLSN